MDRQRDVLNIYPKDCVIHIYNGETAVTETYNTDSDEASCETPICTMCGKPMDEFDIQEHFGFDYIAGYGSKYDGEHLYANLCCNCFDSLVDHMIPLCKTSPIVGDNK